MLEAEFLAIALVLVYVGAVMVLFLFVVMMLDIDATKLRANFRRYFPVGVLVALAMMYSIVKVISREGSGLVQTPSIAPKNADYNNTRELGLALYQDFIWPFEIASVVLLVAIIAAITLTLRTTRQTKAPKPEHQVSVSRETRIRLVEIDSEPPA